MTRAVAVSVAQLVRGDVAEAPATVEARWSSLRRALVEAVAVGGEEELGRASGARAWDRPAGAASGGDAVDES